MSGITAIPLVTVIATILSVDGHHARIDAGLAEGLRPDDQAVIFYMMPVGTERKKVIVNRGIVIELDDHSSMLRVDSEFIVLPGYSAELEVPMGRVDPLSIVELARDRLLANRSMESLPSLIETLIPEDELVEQQILRTIEARRKRRGVYGFTTRQNANGNAPAQRSTPAPIAVSAELAKVVRGWAQAWGDQRVDDYLAFYSRGFLTPGNMRRGDWEAQRRQRLSGPRFIELTVDFLASELIDDSRGWIEFRQEYRSDRFRDAVTKRLELIREDGSWKILQETSAN
ncbi:MAG: hypothetical protein AAF560_03050 [Acidobacteriota bacterium]